MQCQPAALADNCSTSCDTLLHGLLSVCTAIQIRTALWHFYIIPFPAVPYWSASGTPVAILYHAPPLGFASRCPEQLPPAKLQFTIIFAMVHYACSCGNNVTFVGIVAVETGSVGIAIVETGTCTPTILESCRSALIT